MPLGSGGVEARSLMDEPGWLVCQAFLLGGEANWLSSEADWLSGECFWLTGELF